MNTNGLSEKRELQLSKAELKRVQRHGNDKQQESVLLNRIGNLYEKVGDYDRAIEYHRRDMELCGEDTLDGAVAMGRIGHVHFVTEEYEKALQYQLNHHRLASKFESWIEVQRACCSLGNTFLYRPSDDPVLKREYLAKAHGYFQESLDHALGLFGVSIEGEESANQIVSDSYLNLGLSLHELGQYDEAIDSYKQSFHFASLENDPERKERYFANMTDLYEHMGEIGKALAVCDAHLNLVTNNKMSETRVQISIARLYLGQKRYHDAQAKFRAIQKAILKRRSLTLEFESVVTGFLEQLDEIFDILDNVAKLRTELERKGPDLAKINKLVTLLLGNLCDAESAIKIAETYWDQIDDQFQTREECFVLYQNYGKALAQLGRHTEALIWFRKGLSYSGNTISRIEIWIQLVESLHQIPDPPCRSIQEAYNEAKKQWEDHGQPSGDEDLGIRLYAGLVRMCDKHGLVRELDEARDRLKRMNEMRTQIEYPSSESDQPLPIRRGAKKKRIDEINDRECLNDQDDLKPPVPATRLAIKNRYVRACSDIGHVPNEFVMEQLQSAERNGHLVLAQQEYSPDSPDLFLVFQSLQSAVVRELILLNLRLNELDDRFWRKLESILNCSEGFDIHNLDLSFNFFAFKPWHEIRWISTSGIFSRLETINLENNCLDDQSLDFVCDLLDRCGMLISLNLGFNNLEFVSIPKYSAHASSLKALYIDGNPINPQNMGKLVNLINAKIKGLEILGISTFKPLTWPNLPRLVLSHLYRLDAREHVLGNLDQFSECFSDCRQTITGLDLSYSTISNPVALCGAVSRFVRLKELALNGIRLDSEDLLLFPFSLTRLSLENCQLGFHDLLAILRHLPQTQITLLNLSNNDFFSTESELETLFQALRGYKGSLSRLWLNSTLSISASQMLWDMIQTQRLLEFPNVGAFQCYFSQHVFYFWK